MYPMYHTMKERRNPKPHQCWIELFSNNNILNEIDTDSNMQHDCHYIVKSWFLISKKKYILIKTIILDKSFIVLNNISLMTEKNVWSIKHSVVRLWSSKVYIDFLS